MFRVADILLIVVVFSSMFAGIAFPSFGEKFSPFTLHGMMLLLFLSFLSFEMEEMINTVKTHLGVAMWLTIFKLIFLPLTVFFIFKEAFPEYAIACMLLSGVSTGVVAPFISTLVESNRTLVLIMVIISSLLVPFSLPFLVKILAGKSIQISIFSMIRMLSMVIFVPIISCYILKRYLPSVSKFLLQNRYPISLIIFAIINLGVFSGFSMYFRQRPEVLVEASIIALSLGGLLFLLGIVALWWKSPEDRIASAISSLNMNNVLIIVFSSKFFGPLEATVASMYMLPFFLFIFPMRAYEKYYIKDSQ